MTKKLALTRITHNDFVIHSVSTLRQAMPAGFFFKGPKKAGDPYFCFGINKVVEVEKTVDGVTNIIKQSRRVAQVVVGTYAATGRVTWSKAFRDLFPEVASIEAYYHAPTKTLLSRTEYLALVKKVASTTPHDRGLPIERVVRDDGPGSIRFGATMLAHAAIQKTHLIDELEATFPRSWKVLYSFINMIFVEGFQGLSALESFLPNHWVGFDHDWTEADLIQALRTVTPAKLNAFYKRRAKRKTPSRPLVAVVMPVAMRDQAKASFFGVNIVEAETGHTYLTIPLEAPFPTTSMLTRAWEKVFKGAPADWIVLGEAEEAGEAEPGPTMGLPLIGPLQAHHPIIGQHFEDVRTHVERERHYQIKDRLYGMNIDDMLCLGESTTRLDKGTFHYYAYFDPLEAMETIVDLYDRVDRWLSQQNQENPDRDKDSSYRAYVKSHQGKLMIDDVAMGQARRQAGMHFLVSSEAWTPEKVLQCYQPRRTLLDLYRDPDPAPSFEDPATRLGVMFALTMATELRALLSHQLQKAGVISSVKAFIEKLNTLKIHHTPQGPVIDDLPRNLMATLTEMDLDVIHACQCHGIDVKVA